MGLRASTFALLLLTAGFSLLAPANMGLVSGVSSATGTVCIGSPSNRCSSAPASLTGLVGSPVRIAVNILVTSGLSGISGFFNAVNIMVKADPSMLNATGFDLSNSVLTNPSVGIACVNGKLISGFVGCSPQDGPGIAHLWVAAGCAGISLICSFSSGNLFSINYKVLKSSNVSPVVFQTGCSSTSNATSCVTVQWIPANIACCPPPDPENIETATFTTGIISSSFNQIIGPFEGATITESGNVLANQTSQTLTGQLFVTAVNSTTGKTFYSNSFNLNTPLKIGGASETFIVKIFLKPEALGSTCSLSFLLGTVSCFITRNPDINGDGVVDIIDVSMVAFAFDSSIGSARYSPALDLDADGTISIVDVSIIASDFEAPVLA